MVPGYADGQELGRGPAGRTVLARHTATGANAVIRYRDSDDRAHRDLARRLLEIRSPHVAQLYEYVESDAGIALVREYVSGASLGVVAAAGAMKPELALTVLKGGLLGLGAGHAAGVGHGAYTPTNVLVDSTGRVTVTDFGLASIAARAPAPDPTADRSAAVAMFRANLAGRRADRLPRRLRGLPAALAAADGAAEPVTDMLAELEAAARKAYGADWEVQGREKLGGLAARHAGRATGRGRPDR
jgi:serine/threonine protein kinase